MGLPHTRTKHDLIWVIVESLTKSAHFHPVKATYPAEDYALLFMKDILKLHGAHLSIISDRDTKFTSHFWNAFQSGIRKKVNLSATFYPKTDDQAEHTIQTIEDMLRECVIDFKGNWNDHLPLIKFSYNKSYHSTISRQPYRHFI